MPYPTLASVLFREYRRKVLGLLLLKPSESFHVREIARLTDTVPGTLHRELNTLSRAGILNRQNVGNQVLYSANTDCVIFGELSSILRKTSGVADVLRDALLPVRDELETVLVFGSVASGKAREGSDIDLLVIGNASFSDLVARLYPAQETLGREINPKLYSRGEWIHEMARPSAFASEILSKPVINVIGGKDDLGEPAGKQPGSN